MKIKKRSTKPKCSPIFNINSIMRIWLAVAITTVCLFFVQMTKLHNSFPPRKEYNPPTENRSAKNEQLNYSQAPTIAYAVSVTACSKEQVLMDGAAILRHSIHLNSIQNPASKSKYNYQMIAIIHPQAMSCIASEFEALGYQVYERDTPVKVSEIQGDFLREKVESNGCCGEKEFIKLWSLSFIDFPVVVHLDLDTVVFRPMDGLFDAMLHPSPAQKLNIPESRWKLDEGSIQPMWTDHDVPNDIQAYFTRDYNMANPNLKYRHVGVQGGFFIVKPDLEQFEEYKSIIRIGDYTEHAGWGGKHYGPFYGAMTFQGILPYYYDELHPNTAVELNRCFYNAMGDNPRVNPTKNNVVSGLCRDGREDCEDCREMHVDQVVTAHFTLCQKPWLCIGHDQDLLQHRLCRKMHEKWFEIRADLEGGEGNGKHDVAQFSGFCKGPGKRGYIPLNLGKIPSHKLENALKQ